MTQVTSALGRERMTHCDESRMNLEAARPNTLLRKRAIRMGTWNVILYFKKLNVVRNKP